MRFHLLMLIIVILVSLGMHGLAAAGVVPDVHAHAGVPLASTPAAPAPL